jgi:hypothetical protein
MTSTESWDPKELAECAYSKLNSGMWAIGYVFLNERGDVTYSLTDSARIDGTPLTKGVLKTLLNDYTNKHGKGYFPVVCFSAVLGTGWQWQGVCPRLFECEERLFSVVAELIVDGVTAERLEAIRKSASQFYRDVIRDEFIAWAEQNSFVGKVLRAGGRVAYRDL